MSDLARQEVVSLVEQARDAAYGLLTRLEPGQRATVLVRPHTVRTMSALPPRDVPKAWRTGLSAVLPTKAKTASVYKNGRWKTMPLVVEFDCPFDHLDPDEETWATVRLVVNPHTGWVSIHESSCRRCESWAIDQWLVTCQSCAAGADCHPEHPPFFVEWAVWADEDDEDWQLPHGWTWTDEREEDAFLTCLGHEETIRRREACVGWLACPDDSPIGQVLHAMRLLMVGEAPNAPAERHEWTEAKVQKFLAEHVPVTSTQKQAWAIAREIGGHPTQAEVHAAQKERRRA